MTVLLTRRAVVRAAMEAEYGVPAALTADDGVLVSEPTYDITPNVLERNFTRDTLSTQPHIIGRRLAKMEFTTELRGNGRQHSGIAADAPIIARLFRMCGYSLTASAVPGSIGPLDIGDPTVDVTWAANAAAATNTEVHPYILEVTTAGESGTAMVKVTSDTPAESTAAAIITSGTPFPLGTKGLTVTPTFAGELPLGQRWIVWLTPKGIRLDPVSKDFESGTLEMNKDGVLHTMPASYGTFEITAEAGQFASIKWTFQGAFQDPVDSPMVTPNYEKTLPAQVELARLRMDGVYLIVAKYTFNQANDIQVRPDVSSKEGYIGTMITARKPEAGIDPEADLVGNFDFWGKFGAATRMPFQMRVGTKPGNTVWMLLTNTQFTGMTYQDRNGIMTYQAGLNVAGIEGDDECCFFLC